MYEYNVIEVPVHKGFKSKIGDSFSECVKVIEEQAKAGWRLVQIVIPPNEKAGIMMAYSYQIIFEKEI